MVTLLATLVLGFQAVKPVVSADLPKFDKKAVTVVGKVSEFKEKVAKTSKRPYTIFVLTDRKGKVNVFFQGKLTTRIKDGDKVSVTGLYQKEKKIKDRVYKNEIDATNTKNKNFGVKPVK
ncbi:MAG: hypothetical protein JNM34_00755 [Chthonomonadaceae bacterium]|nr:hypothetical protein [Chthonomonadaceae bacterium]